MDEMYPEGSTDEPDSRPMAPFWSTIYQFIRPYRGQLLVSTVCAMGVGFVSALQPLIIKWLIDDAILRTADDGNLAPLGERVRYIVYIVGFFVALCVFRLSVGVYGFRFMVRGVEQFLCDLRGRFFRHVQQLCFRFHDEISSGELFNYIMGSPVQSLKMFLHQGALIIPIQAVAWTVAMVTLASFNVPMTLITMAMVTMIVLVNHRSRLIIRDMSGTFMETESEVSKYVADMLRGCRAIKIYAIEDSVSGSFEGQIRRVRDQGVRLAYRRHIENVKAEGVRYVGMTAIYLAGGWFCLYRDMQVGTFVAFVTSINMLMAPLMALLQLNLIRGNAEAGLDRIVRILELQKTTGEPSPDTQINVHPQADHARAGSVPCVEMVDVCFAYRDDRVVLDHITCSIPDGQSVALIGPSGSGKTTFISLLLRLYDPQGGAIRLNGADLRSYSLKDLRAAFGVVPQDPFIFQATVRNNIRVTNTNATDEELRHAMELAHVAEFIDQMPNGLDTMVGESGSNLSGGQCQRLAIARAVLADPRYFIFDEATSALDNQSERRIQAAMDTLMTGRTSFVIAHRLSTIRNVDRILVFQDGRIVQDGSYAELADSEGLFADMLASAAFTDVE